MKASIKSKLGYRKRRLLEDLPDRRQIAQLSEAVFNTQALQRSLYLNYRQLLAQRNSLPRFQDIGFRVYSQNDEDGLLLYIFSLIGFTSKTGVEIACGHPHGANTTNLICNWGFTGLLVDGNEDCVRQSQQFFGSHADTLIYPPKVVRAWITAENVNSLLRENGIEGEVDLFSLDIDGVDYWVWKSLDAIQPRVVVAEYQNIWDSEKSLTVPYKPDFVSPDMQSNYFGASLSAFVKLGREKGYRLVGCNRYGFNAFFVHNGLGEEILPEVSPKECLNHPQAKEGRRTKLPGAKKYEWVEV